MSYTEHTLADAIEAVRLKMVSEAYPARQAAIDAAIAEVDLTVAEYFFQRAEATRERVYGFVQPRMPELAPPQETPPVALQSAPAQPYVDPFDDEIYEMPNVVRGMR